MPTTRPSLAPLTPRRHLRWLVVAVLLFAAVLASPRTAEAAYPGSDGKIALVRANQIYTINSDGTGLTQLTSSAKNYWPRWSPNGARIAFIHETAAASKDIWVMAANGSNKKQVTHLGSVTAPTWSPNGKLIAFGSPLQRIKSTAPFGQPTVIMGSEDGGAREPLQVEPGGSVAWSPDGDTIAYYSNSFPDSPDHFLLTFDTGTRDVVEFNLVGGSCCGEGYFADLAWSADGTKLAYTNGSYFPENGDPVSPGHVTIETWPVFSSTYPAVNFDKQPALSPSGSFVAVANTKNRTQRIFITAANGSGRRLLTNGYQPDWQPLP